MNGRAMNFNLTKLVKSTLLSPRIAQSANATKPTLEAWKEQNSLRFTSIHFTFELISDPRTRKDSQCHPHNADPRKHIEFQKMQQLQLSSSYISSEILALMQQATEGSKAEQ